MGGDVKRRSISQRLTHMNMVVSGVAVVTACLAFIVYDVVTFRDTTVRTLSTRAQIIGANTVSALVFDDVAAAEKTLGALRAAPEVISAHVYGSDGSRFASYWRDGLRGVTAPPAIPPGQDEAYVFDGNSIALTRRITFDGTATGTVYVQSDLRAIYARLTRYAVIGGGVLLASMLAALLVSRFVRRDVADPLIALARAARQVSAARDYTVRVAPMRADEEVTVLVDAFNEMLAQIHERDVSLEQARAELEERVRQRTAELEVMNKELESFSYSVSHDLRAPLRHITGFASMLKQRSGDALDEKSRHYLATMFDAATRMGRLIDDLLAFSRMGRASLSMRPVALGPLVEEVRAEVSTEAAGRQIAWDIHPLPAVQADPALLRQVLVNLLSNSVKYTGTRPLARIEVGTAVAEDGQVVIFVRDNGVGFDMAYIDKLFGVFQRLHRSEEFSGTGIGLATCGESFTATVAAPGPRDSSIGVQPSTSHSQPRCAPANRRCPKPSWRQRNEVTGR
jgi:signal transduction histidine kinase